MKKRLLVMAIIVTFLIGTMSFAKESEPVTADEVMVIDAEEIRITPIEYFEETEVEEDAIEESEAEFEEPNESAFEEVPEETEEDEDYENNEEVTESPAPPEGKVEGYVEGIYFDPNTVDCEICGGECYTCHDEHVYEHCVSIDDRGYILEEWCTICGHGTDTVISDEEFEALGVETYVGF